MTNPTITIHNVETGELIEREMNAEELAHLKAVRDGAAEEKAQAEADATAKQAILDRLGLTAEEAALLLK